MKSVIKADKEKQISAIDKRLYSSFIGKSRLSWYL